MISAPGSAGLLRQTAADIADGADACRSAERLAQARTLGGEVQRVEIALTDSEESLRLNPRARIRRRPRSRCGPAWRHWSTWR